MKIAFLGDSITEGNGASSLERCYVSLVGEKLSCEVLNYGIGGTRIARRKKLYKAKADVDFNLRTVLLDRTADKIVVFGGTNDYGSGDAVMGKEGDVDLYSFHGAVNTLFTTLIDMYGRENVLIILPLKRYNMNVKVNEFSGKYLVDYVEVVIFYAKKYGLRYLDLFNDGFAEPPKGESEYFTDGLHPNDKGYEVIAEKICEFIKNDK